MKLDAIYNLYVAGHLEKFRKDLEEGETPIHAELPVSLVLADLCEIFGFSEDQTRHVLGESTYKFLQWSKDRPIPYSVVSEKLEEEHGVFVLELG